MHLISNVVISIIVLYIYIMYIGLTIIKCNVLTCLTIVKSLGHSDQKWSIATILLKRCDIAARALRLGLGHSSSGAFRHRGILTIILVNISFKLVNAL